MNVRGFGCPSPALIVFLLPHLAGWGLAQPRSAPARAADFFEAIRMEREDAALTMLESDTNLVRIVYNASKRPLLEAAAAGQLRLVKRMLELGADIHAQGDVLASAGSGNTALHWAIRGHHIETCRFLLEAGADPNQMAGGYQTPLHLAFKEDREEIAGLLMDYGAEPFQGKLFTNNDETPFELAVTESRGRLVPRMLGQEKSRPLGSRSVQKPGRRPRDGMKTSTEVLNRRGVELVTIAAQRGELEAVLALLHAGVGIKPGNTNCPTILQAFALAFNNTTRALPAVRSDLRSVQERLRADYIPKADARYVASLRSEESGLSNRVALMAPERWRKIQETLVANGADYDVFAATALGDEAHARDLISRSKEVVQMRDCGGDTPLQWAIQTDQSAMVPFWISAGASINATNHAGRTALHLAAATGKANFVKALLAAKASTGIRDTNGWTALGAAIKGQHAGCIQLLLPASPAEGHLERGLSTKLHEAAANGNVAALVMLLEAETNLEAKNELGLTPLHLAVRNGHLAVAALLVDKGADINARDPEGNTILQQVIPHFFGFFVKDRPPTSWLDRLANDPRKETFVKYLTIDDCEQGTQAMMQTTCFLVACGIDTQAINQAGETAVQIAEDEDTSLFDEDRELLIDLLKSHRQGSQTK